MSRKRSRGWCSPWQHCQILVLTAVVAVTFLVVVTTLPQHGDEPLPGVDVSLGPRGGKERQASPRRSLSAAASSSEAPPAAVAATAPVAPAIPAAPAVVESARPTCRTEKLAPGLHATACALRRHTAPLFVAVTSPVGNFNLRKELRKGKWLMSTFPKPDRASYMFFVGSSNDKEVQDKVQQEMEKHGDVVQLDMLDTYQHLAVKSVAAAAWMDSQLDTSVVQYWLKVEDFMTNNFKDVDAVVQSLSRRHSTKPYYGGGMLFGGASVVPDGRWGCPKRHCPYDKYPVTYAGGQYLLSAGAVHILASKGLPGLNLKDPYPIEDHYVASILFRAGVSVAEDRKLLWGAGKPYGAPSVVAGDFLLCLDTEDRPELEEGEEGVWEGSVWRLPAGKRVEQAWYGDPGARWVEAGGKDVTDEVRKRLKTSAEVRAGNEFGDPAPGKRKVLLLRVGDRD